MQFYLIAADVYIRAGYFDGAVSYLRAALGEANRAPSGSLDRARRASIMRALNYARALAG